eukprot:scaffold36310_cov118-Isochrysis_galbana.AAC.7
MSEVIAAAGKPPPTSPGLRARNPSLAQATDNGWASGLWRLISCSPRVECFSTSRRGTSAWPTCLAATSGATPATPPRNESLDARKRGSGTATSPLDARTRPGSTCMPRDLPGTAKKESSRSCTGGVEAGGGIGFRMACPANVATKQPPLEKDAGRGHIVRSLQSGAAHLRWSVYGQRALSRIEPSEEGRLRLERHLDVRTAGARSLRLDRLDHPRAHLHLRLCTHALFRRRGRLLGSSSRGSPHTSLLARASLKLGFQMLDLLPELVDFILEIGHHLRALGPRLVDRLHRQPLVVPRAKSLLSQRFKRRLERLDDAPASLGHAAPEASVAPTGRHGLARGGLPGQAHIRTQGCGSPVVESGISFRPRPQRLLVPRRRAVPSTAQRQVVSRQGGGGAEGGAGGGAGVRAARGRAVDRMVGEGVARRRANVVEHSKRLERINHLRCDAEGSCVSRIAHL